MPIKPRLAPMVGAALISLAVASAVGAAEPGKKATQLPNQVIPTDAEDGAAPAAAARSALARSASTAPTADQLEAQLRHMTSESSEGLVAVRKAGKSRQVDLDGRFMSVAVARQTTDGGTEVSCLTGRDALNAVHAADRGEKVVSSTKQPAAAPMEEK